MEDYIVRKEKGLVQIIKSGDVALMLVKQFNPVTGEELAPQPAQISVSALEEQKAGIQAQLDNITAMIEDINKL